jgi:quercetin dioxygenase-like cupin family protein
MKTKSLFKILFKEKVDTEFEKTHDEFRKLSKKAKEFKHKLLYEIDDPSAHNDNTPEANMNEISFVKNEWIRLPDAAGNGVLSMGMEESSKRKSFLVHYEPNSELFTHKHPHNIERIQVLSGYIRDNVNGQTIDEGDTYLIDKNISHNIVTLDKEAYLYIVFSEELDTLTVKNLI